MVDAIQGGTKIAADGRGPSPAIGSEGSENNLVVEHSRRGFLEKASWP